MAEPLSKIKGTYSIGVPQYEYEWDTWETKVGIAGSHMIYHYKACGFTEEESFKRAKALVSLLVKSKNPK